MTDISWAVVTVKLSQLVPWEQNPKTSTAKNAKQLVSSVDELGQFQTVAIGPFDASGMATVYDGHQRLSAWMRQYGADYEAQALQASRPLTEQERRKIAIYSRQIGAWDWDILSGWEPEELTGWGFDVDLLSDWGKDYSNLREMLALPPADPANDPWAEWEGMPEFEQEDVSGIRLIVHFARAESVSEFGRLIGQDVNENTKSIWYPKLERENLKQYRVIDES